MPTLPSEFASIILAFAPLFFNGVWYRAQILLIGAILAPGKRTVTSALRVMGLSDERHFQMYHRVLNRAVWSCRQAGCILLCMLVAAFAPTGPLVFVIDDTIGARVESASGRRLRLTKYCDEGASTVKTGSAQTHPANGIGTSSIRLSQRNPLVLTK